MPRNSRYSDLQKYLCDVRVHIVGCGAIGSCVARTLAVMGVETFTLWDDDSVCEENLGTQGWRVSDLGKYKVEALAEMMQETNPDVKITSRIDRWESSTKFPRGMVFACVDSMEARRWIAEAYGKKKPVSPPLYLDARMAAEVYTIYAVTPATFNAYVKTLHADSEAYRGPCTLQSTYYCASMAACRMISKWLQFVRGMPVTFATTDVLRSSAVLNETHQGDIP